MPLDAKTVYAKSSDIKGRTYLEYRRDMKRKAIAELEMMVYLPSILEKEFQKKDLSVRKSGGDRFLWFLRKGGITREPDFIVYMGTKEIEVEFQHAMKTDLDFYDFKVSKVSKGKRENKKPIPDKYFLYLHIPSQKYAFFDTNWVISHSEYGMVEAWRSYAYRVPKEEMEKILKKHSCLKKLIYNIEAKENILNFQFEQINIIADELSYLLQQVIDKKKILNITPDTLDSIFRICFILDNINKIPQNINLWLIYLLSFVNKKNTLSEIYKIVYSLDFLYSKIGTPKENEINTIVNSIKQLIETVRSYYNQNGSYTSSPKESPFNETRYALFSINLLEDLIQDLIFYYSVKNLSPVSRIYENLNDFSQTYKFIQCSYK